MKRVMLICATFLIGAGCICSATNIQAADTSGPAPDNAGCQTAWTIASPNGATLSKDAAVPYIVDFTLVDTNGDGAIDANEFNAACLGGNTTFSEDVQAALPRRCSSGLSPVCSGGICFCPPG
jgi:hypothetical protein